MPNHASHHHDRAGNARAGSAPMINAAARPDQVRLGWSMPRRGCNLSPKWDRRILSRSISAHFSLAHRTTASST